MVHRCGYTFCQPCTDLARGRPGSAGADSCLSSPVLYLTADTMQWVTARKELQQYLRAERAECSRRRLLIGFAGVVLHWRGAGFTAHACRRADAWLTAIDCSIAQAWASYNFAGRFLRNAVRADRNRYLESLVHDVRLSDLARPRQLYQRVRKAFPKAAAARRSSFTTLPSCRAHRWLPCRLWGTAGTAVERAFCRPGVRPCRYGR